MKAAAVLALTCSGLPLFAGAQAPLKLTLEDAIARGIQTSHKLAEAEARRRQSKGVADARAAEKLPVIAVHAGYSRTSHVPETSLTDPTTGESFKLFTDVPDNMRTRIDLRWPIYTGGRVNALERAALAETDALEQDRVAAQADLKLEITRAFWAVITADASAKVLDQALARTGSHLSDSRSRLQVGLIPPNDVFSTEAQQSRQEVLLIRARNLHESALGDLRRLTGLAPGAAVEVDATLTPPEGSTAAPTALVEQARTGRPERRALEFRVKGASDQKRAADAGWYPTLWLGGGYDYNRPNAIFLPREAIWNGSWDFTVNLDFTLWNFGRTKAEVAQAAANRDAVDAALRDFDTILETDVRQRQLDLQAALAEIRSAEDGVKSAAEAHRIVSQQYAAQITTNTEVLDAQQALLVAELDRTRAIAGARLAAARLDRAVGR